MLTMLESLRQVLANQTAAINTLIGLVKELSKRQVTTNQPDMPQGFLFSLQETVDLQRMEEWLDATENKDAKNRMVQYINNLTF